MSLLGADKHLRIAQGIGGNFYAYSTDKFSVMWFCVKIGKSENSIYYNEKFKCWAVRMKSAKHKRATLQFMVELRKAYDEDCPLA